MCHYVCGETRSPNAQFCFTFPGKLVLLMVISTLLHLVVLDNIMFKILAKRPPSGGHARDLRMGRLLLGELMIPIQLPVQ